MQTYLSIDLGQMRDYAAAAVVRSLPVLGPDGRPGRSSTGAPLRDFEVMALKRYPLGTAYADVVAHVVQQAIRPELHTNRPPIVCWDNTGVGAGIGEMLRTALKPHPEIAAWAITITAGRTVHQTAPRQVNVAKVELAGAIRQVLEDGRLKIPATLEYADALKRELADFTINISESANELFEAGAGSSDDLVIATALPIWFSTWLDTRQTFIAGPGTPIRVENDSAAARAVRCGAPTRQSDRDLFGRPGGDADRRGWRPGAGGIPLAPRGSSGIFGDPG
jgi:hypothetical protein